MSTATTPSVWIGCLASYNSGRLIGEWVSATDVDEMNEARTRVAKTAVKAADEAGEYPVYFGEPEEFYIADYDGFGNLASTLGEYPSYETVARIGALIEQEGEVIIAWINACEVDVEDANSVTLDAFYEVHRGEWDSEESFAQYYVNEVGWNDVPVDLYTSPYSQDRINVFDELSAYIDWSDIARQLFANEYTYADGYVFEPGA